MKILLKIVVGIVAVISLLLAFAMARNWIFSFRPDPNQPGENGRQVFINDMEHYTQDRDGWFSYHSWDVRSGKDSTFRIHYSALVALFAAFPALCVLQIVRGRNRRRRQRGFEVTAGRQGPDGVSGTGT